MEEERLISRVSCKDIACLPLWGSKCAHDVICSHLLFFDFDSEKKNSTVDTLSTNSRLENEFLIEYNFYLGNYPLPFLFFLRFFDPFGME
jgi:hypothetical protein